jgi:cytoskeletal protein CcmA (bactofilin family)
MPSPVITTDQDKVLEQDKQDSEAEGAQTSPRLDLSKAARSAVRPPAKAFSARPLKRGLFRTSTLTRETPMSDRFSSDRMAAFNPQIPRRIADIPNSGVLRGIDPDGDGKRLTVGKAVHIKGEISGCERLMVDGHVDAAVSGVKTLEVTTNGTFKGSAEVDSAVIAGTYDGDLKVNGHLEIAASGVVTGKVSYKTIAVANGGRLQGAVETL